MYGSKKRNRRAGGSPVPGVNDGLRGGALAEFELLHLGREGVEYALVGGIDLGGAEGLLRVAVEESVGHGQGQD